MSPNFPKPSDYDDDFNKPTIREYSDDEIVWIRVTWLVIGHLLMLGEWLLFDYIAELLT